MRPAGAQVRVIAGGGAADVPWSRLAVTPAALVNTGGILDAASSFDGQGRATLIFASHTTTQVGFRNANLARWVAQLPVAIDPDRDQIELMIDAAGWVHNTVETGVFFGLLDSATVDSNLQGACIGWRSSTATASVAGRFTDSSITPFINSLAYDAVRCAIRLGNTGSVYTGALAIEGRVSGTDRWQLITSSTADNLRQTVANWRLHFGAWHGSADDVDGQVQQVDLLYRVTPQLLDRPAYWPLPSKPASTLNVVIIGDSTSIGNGADPTFTGSEDPEVYYGGVALPAGVEVYEQGVSQASWPDNAGNGGDPGIMPHLAREALAAGFTTVRIFRHGVNGAATSTVGSTYLPATVQQVIAEGLSPDDIGLLVVQAGTNDSQTGEGAALEATAASIADACRSSYRRARLLWVGPSVVQASGWDEADLARTSLQSALTGRGTYVDGTGVGLADSTHPSLAGYATLGARVWAAWLVAP